MTSLRWLPGRALAGHIIARRNADPRRMNDRMLRDSGIRRDQITLTFRNEEVVVR